MNNDPINVFQWKSNDLINEMKDNALISESESRNTNNLSYHETCS